jgi:phosphatidylserine synthase
LYSIPAVGAVFVGWWLCAIALDTANAAQSPAMILFVATIVFVSPLRFPSIETISTSEKFSTPILFHKVLIGPSDQVQMRGIETVAELGKRLVESLP